MWNSPDLPNKSSKPGPRYTQPDWFTKCQLTTSRSELQRLTASQIVHGLQCARDDASTQIYWATQNTLSGLSCRVEQLKQWRHQIADSISQVNQEISLLEKLKASAETCLQVKALYRQVLGECATLRDGRMAGKLVHDHVEVQLAREVQLCEDIKRLIQQRITEVLEQLRTLKEMRSQLLADQNDKDDAISLNSQCLSLDLKSPSVGYRYQPSKIAQRTLTYEQWITHCQNLTKSVQKLIQDSSYFRSNLKHTLCEVGESAKFTNALECQRSATDFSFRKRLDELSRAKDALEWEKQQVMDSVSVLQAEMEKVKDQILSSSSEEQLAQTRLDILAQRWNYEVCLDQTKSLYRNTFSLKKNLHLSQNTLDAMSRNLFKLEDGLNEKTRSIEINKKCQEVRQQLLDLCKMPTIPVDPAQSQDSSSSAVTSHVTESNGQ